MVYDVDNVIYEILKEIRPSEHERRKLIETYYNVKFALESCILSTLDKEIEITLQGSAAKDTFLRGQSDIDVFLLFTPHSNVSIKWFEKTLIPALIDCFKNHRYVLNYASHPYLTLYINDVEVNIVPAFKVSHPSEIISAVDRTPFHTEYIKKRLTDEQKDEVRLLKQFLKQWNLYGAETSVKGFSGYLTELLIIAYGTFYSLLKSSINWSAYRTCIDIENHYTSSNECLKRFRNDVLVVVDPVDSRRNVAAALSIRNFALFKFLARLFVEKPSLVFFRVGTLDQFDDLPAEKLIDLHLKNYESCIYGLEFKVIKPVPEVLWGQLNRLRTIIINMLKSQKIGEAIYVDSWINEALTQAVIAVEILYCSKKFVVHTGPYAYDTYNALRFLVKNKNSEIVPWIDDNGRLYTIKRINASDIEKIILDLVLKFSPTSLKFANLLNLKDIKALCSVDPKFKQWLKGFLERNPFKRILKLLENLDLNS